MVKKNQRYNQTNYAASVQSIFESTSFRFISCETSSFDASLLTLRWQRNKCIWSPSGTTAEGVRNR